MALTDKKRGRKGGLTPFELLASACEDNDRQSLALWIEYLQATPQIQVLRWSNGLKALAGVDDVSDADAAKNEKQDEQVETGRANIPHGSWKKVPGGKGRKDRRSEILDIAESDGADAAAAAAVSLGDEDEEQIKELLEVIEQEPERWTPRPAGWWLRPWPLSVRQGKGRRPAQAHHGSVADV